MTKELQILKDCNENNKYLLEDKLSKRHKQKKHTMNLAKSQKLNVNRMNTEEIES